VENSAIRVAVVPDVPELIDLRLQLFADVRHIAAMGSETELRNATERYFADAMNADDGNKTWVAVVNERIVATGTLAVFQRPPSPNNLFGLEAYLLNMYTVPAYRSKGIATTLLTEMMAFARSAGYGKVWLHASAAGRSLYESYGFKVNATALEWQPD
jgi:GNAT superfamily N-acetyltransferase